MSEVQSRRVRAPKEATLNQRASRGVMGSVASALGFVNVIKMPRVKMIEARPGYWLAVTFADGCEILVDLGDVIRRGGQFKPLQNQQLFSQATASLLGDRIEWPEPKDEHGEPLICIDAASLYGTFDAVRAPGYRKSLV
jgi:hypothetical protein